MTSVMEKIEDIGCIIFFSILPVSILIAAIIGIWEEKFPKSWKKVKTFWIRHEMLQKVVAGIVLILLTLAFFGAGMHVQVPSTVG